MRKIKINKKWIASLAAVALLATGITIPSLKAANSIDLDATCSLTISVDSTEYAEDLENVSVPVKVYKVADVDADGNFTATADFEDLELSDMKTDTKGWKDKVADAWKNVPEKAVEILEKKAESGKEVATAKETTITGGTGVFSDMPVGLYLVIAEDADSSSYSYSFSPYLISLPNNIYRQTGSGEDEWIYDASAGLKPERSDRYGSLKIVKTLNTYDATKGRETFVFQVEGTKNGKTVYSNVVSIDFDGTELPTREAVLENIPIGTEITVSEVYSGASYALSSDEVVNAGTIAADQMIEADFTNDTSGSRNSGYGICNRFDWSEDENAWDWSQTTDSTASVEKQ